MTAHGIDPSLAWHVAGGLGFCCVFVFAVVLRKHMNAAALKWGAPSILSRLVISGSVMWAVFGAARVIGADGTNESAWAFVIGGVIGLWSAIAFEPKVIGSQEKE
jgi:hypothetical protein